MKIKLSLIILFIVCIQIQANASVNVSKMLSEEYMINSGYSMQIHDTANVSRARALGQEYYSKSERKYKNKSRAGRFFRHLNTYIDPALDDYSFYHHDSKPEPSVDDL